MVIPPSCFKNITGCFTSFQILHDYRIVHLILASFTNYSYTNKSWDKISNFRLSFVTPPPPPPPPTYLCDFHSIGINLNTSQISTCCYLSLTKYGVITGLHMGYTYMAELALLVFEKSLGGIFCKDANITPFLEGLVVNTMLPPE